MIDKRKRILQATAEMISEYGLTCCPMSKISAKAGCGAGTIYRYFETKDDLVIALFHELVQKLTNVCLDGYNPEESLRERFFKIWRNYFQFVESNPADRALMEQLFASPAISNADKDESFRTLRDTTFPILEEGKKQGVFKDVPNEVINTFVFGSLTQMSKKFENCPNMCETESVDTLLQLCWDAIRQ